MFELLVRWRVLSFALVVLALGCLLLWGRAVDYDQSLTSFFPADDPDVRDYERACEVFSPDNFVFVAYTDEGLLGAEGMDRQARLREALLKVPAVLSVESLESSPPFWRVDEELGRIARLPALLRPAARRLAVGLVSTLGSSTSSLATIGGLLRNTAAEDLPAVQGKILAHPLLGGTLISPDGKCAVLVAKLASMGDQDVRRTIALLRSEADRFADGQGLDRPALVGPPVLLADGFAAIERDGRRLAIVGMILISLVMLSATRSLWWAVVPLIAGWTVWLAAETLLSLLGIRLSLSGGPLVAQIVVLTMPAASHLAIHNRDDLRRLTSRQAAALETLHSVSSPILWCALTGALGYAALLTSTVTPVRQFGAILGGCTLLAAILTLAISPIAMRPPSPLPLEMPVRFGSRSPASTGVGRLLDRIQGYPGLIVLAFLIVAAPVVLGMWRLRFESNYINAFKVETRVVRDYQFVESRIGGIGLVSLVVPLDGPITSEALERLRSTEESIAKKPGSQGRITSVLSLAKVLDPEGLLAGLPTKDQREEALRTKLELIGASAQGELLRDFWNPEEKATRLLIRLPEQQPAPQKEAAFAAALESAREQGKGQQGQEEATGGDCFLTGLSFLLTRTTRAVMTTSWVTFIWAAVTIFSMLVLAFRGPALALLAILPSMLSVGLVLGLMGWIGMKLDLATALIASVALGLSVDDTFHCLLQYRRSGQASLPFAERLKSSYGITGPGVILSSLAVCVGFAALWLSEFVPFSNFGMMVSIATLGSSLGNLVLLPACLTLLERQRESKARKRQGSVAAGP